MPITITELKKKSNEEKQKCNCITQSYDQNKKKHLFHLQYK